MADAEKRCKGPAQIAQAEQIFSSARLKSYQLGALPMKNGADAQRNPKKWLSEMKPKWDAAPLN